MHNEIIFKNKIDDENAIDLIKKLLNKNVFYIL